VKLFKQQESGLTLSTRGGESHLVAETGGGHLKTRPAVASRKRVFSFIAMSVLVAGAGAIAWAMFIRPVHIQILQLDRDVLFRYSALALWRRG
jgi:hypothetical protein